MILYFLPAIIVLGILTSREDMKYGRIRNRHIAFALIYAMLVNIILITYFYFNKSINLGYVFDLMINFLMTIAVAFAVWNYGLWGAGDAKLFIAYSALLPLTVYSNGYIKYFPALLILVNTFVPYTVYALFRAFISTSYKEKMDVIRRAGIRQPFSMLLSFFGIQWAIKTVSGLFGISSYFMDYLLVFIVYYLLEKAIGKKSQSIIFYAALAVSALRFIFDKSILDYGFWYNFIAYYSLFMLMRYFVIELANKSTRKEIPMAELKQGMALAEGIRKEGKGKRIRYVTTEDLKKNFFELAREGLSKAEIKKIKREMPRFAFSRIKIYESMPFAPLMFLGVILTILSNGNFFVMLVKFINMLHF